MKPVAIFRHAQTEGPGYLADFLERKHIPWRLIRIDAGDALPASVDEFSGLVFMGGPMSVNDDLPWIPSVLGLIRAAVECDVPVLGHCLGGQLMSKALGGVVGVNQVKEIGWGAIEVASHATARRWFGDIQVFEGFHWHGETFSLPVGATHLLSSRYCENQAYALGKHLAFQCHIEMNAEMVNTWSKIGAEELFEAASSPGVQQAAEITRDLETRIPALNRVADTVYEAWIAGLSS